MFLGMEEHVGQWGFVFVLSKVIICTGVPHLSTQNHYSVPTMGHKAGDYLYF